MKKGFTLIELLVAISIMVLITGVSLVAFSSARASGRDAKRKADLEATRSALELYRSDLGRYPAALSSLAPTYIAAVLSDPLSDRQYSYTSATTSTYVLCAAVENPSPGASGVGCASCGSISCNYKTINP